MLHLAPHALDVGGAPVYGKRVPSSDELDLITLEHDVPRERRPRKPLAYRTMTLPHPKHAQANKITEKNVCGTVSLPQGGVISF